MLLHEWLIRDSVCNMKLHTLPAMVGRVEERLYGADRPGERLLAVQADGSSDWALFCPLMPDFLIAVGTVLMLAGYPVRIVADPDRWEARLEVAGNPDVLKLAHLLDRPVTVIYGPLPAKVAR